ncbi:hypothetical protein [Helicobacter sp. 13S00477-4]|uniref:hypothetical protein n=1 Tax=Helicobacter sp. 13S00477-4 TaxID=1905759 RepID=UPI000BA5DAEC|nr:hypothetical protein [Helicobacter sp. 13S00477-4]PAF51287.1 hypothetical protein BKH44_06160 [Helicobacter sp. 13S00477-4]
MKIAYLIHCLRELFFDFIPLSSETIKGRGKYFVFEGLSKGENRSLEGSFKLLIAFNTLDKDMNAGLEASDECVLKIFENQALNKQTRMIFEGLRLNAINEGLFVYEISIKLKVAL